MTVGVFGPKAPGAVAVAVGRRTLAAELHIHSSNESQTSMGLMQQYLCAPGTTSSLHTSLPRALTRRKPRPGKPQSFEARAPPAAQSAPPPATALRGPHSVSRGDETT